MLFKGTMTSAGNSVLHYKSEFLICQFFNAQIGSECFLGDVLTIIVLIIKFTKPFNFLKIYMETDLNGEGGNNFHVSDAVFRLG